MLWKGATQVLGFPRSRNDSAVGHPSLEVLFPTRNADQPRGLFTHCRGFLENSGKKGQVSGACAHVSQAGGERLRWF